jgi:hypothetical protein
MWSTLNPENKDNSPSQHCSHLPQNLNSVSILNTLPKTKESLIERLPAEVMHSYLLKSIPSPFASKESEHTPHRSLLALTPYVFYNYYLQYRPMYSTVAELASLPYIEVILRLIK